MNEILKYNNIKLRRLNDVLEDYKCLEKWYQEKEIYYHFEQRKLNLEEIKNKYYERTLEDAKIPVYMICYDDLPIGIIQYQLINNENKKLYNISSERVYEIDIFIGELKFHDRGIGKISIDLISNYLFSTKNADSLVMCPLKENEKAIKCYEKSGYIKKDEFTTEDTIGTLKRYVLMVKEK